MMKKGALGPRRPGGSQGAAHLHAHGEHGGQPGRPGGDRFAQIGITLELADAKAAEQVKTYMPSIRSSVLLLVSQRTTDELLTREGKEKLAQDVRREVSRPLGYAIPKPRKRAAQRDLDDEEEDDDEDERPRRRADDNPVRQVLFSSFIIQ